MIKIDLYKHLSDAKKIIELEAGTYLCDALPNLDWSNVKVFVNGVVKDKNHRVDYGDMIAIRWIPHGTGIVVGLFIVSIIVGVAAGYEAYKAQKAAQKAAKELEKIKSSTRDDITNLPWLKGASNTLSTGKTQPYIIGTHLYTPYILNGKTKSSKGYSTIAGTNGERQFYNVVLEGGFNKQVLSELYTDDILIREFGGVTPQEFPDSNGKSNLCFNNNSIFASNDSFIEIAQDGNNFSSTDANGNDIFNYKIVEYQKSDEVKKHAKSGDDDSGYQDLFYTLEPNSMAADVCIMFNGLLRYDDEGKAQSSERNITPYYSYNYADVTAGIIDEPIVWHPMYFTTCSYTEARTTTVRSTYKFTSEWSESKKTLLKQINRWTLVSGDDIRSDYNVFGFYSTTSLNQQTYQKIYTYYIDLSKTVTIPAHATTISNSTKFSGKFAKQVRYNTHANFSFNDIFKTVNGQKIKKYSQPITIKVSTPDREPSTGTNQDACYVQWVQSHTFDLQKSTQNGAFVRERVIEPSAAALSTLIGLHIESNQANEDKLSSIQVVTNGCARVFDNGVLSTDKKPTSNPAAWLIEVLTSPCHNPSQIDDDEIDFDSFATWYSYCDTKKLEINYVVSQGMQKSALLEMICNIGHGVLYQNIYGKIAVAIDNERQNAVAILNEQNLVSLAWDKDLLRQPDGVKMTYIDAKSNYQQSELTVMYDGSDPANRSPDSVLTEIKCDGITSYEQAYRQCLYTMRCARLRPKTVTATIGKEGLFFKPLDKILLQHPSLKIGLGSAEIKSCIMSNNQITGFELCEAVDLEQNKTYTIVVQCVGSDYCVPRSYAIDSYDGRTKEITLKNPIASTEYIHPKKGDILSYGYGATTTTDEMLIKAVSPTEKGYTLTLVDYDERIFADDDTIPDYEPQLTQPSSTLGSLPSSLPTPTMADVADTVQKAVDSIDRSLVESPNVYAEVMAFGFSVNDDGLSPIAQKIKTTVHVIQSKHEIDFVFGDIVLPDGFTYTIDYHTVTITAAQGVRISTGVITLPIIYREILHDNFYGDEDGTLYTDEGGEIYGEFNYADKLTYYNLGISYQGVKGGKYLGKISNIDDIPTANIVIGDYFTWGADDTGTYTKSTTYAWDGEKWAVDSVSNHLGGALSDVLSIANQNLAQNNSTAYEFVNHLTANSIFVDKLVANTAFINTLKSKEGFFDNITVRGTVYANKGRFEAGLGISQSYSNIVNGKITALYKPSSLISIITLYKITAEVLTPLTTLIKSFYITKTGGSTGDYFRFDYLLNKDANCIVDNEFEEGFYTGKLEIVLNNANTGDVLVINELQLG